MHAFDRRLNQLLDTLGGLTAGRRQRLVRSLRQDDVELGSAAAHPALQAAVKASLRVAAHEILDTLCLHLEGAISRCRSPHAEALLMAIVAVALVDHACVLFDDGQRTAGVSFPAAEAFVIATSPAADCDLQVTWVSTASGGGPTSSNVRVFCRDSPAVNGRVTTSYDHSEKLVVDVGDVEFDPFRIAADLLQHLRSTTP